MAPDFSIPSELPNSLSSSDPYLERYKKMEEYDKDGDLTSGTESSSVSLRVNQDTP